MEKNAKRGFAANLVRLIASRLYLLACIFAVSALAVAWAFRSNDLDGYIHQTIGAMIVAGCIWFGVIYAQAAKAESTKSKDHDS